MPVVEIAYRPREAFRPFHARSQRWSVSVCHRRSGKTVSHINDLIKRALINTRNSPRYAYLAPFRSQAKAVAWGYLKQYTEGIPERIVREGELSVQLPGDRRITLYGADNYDALRGLYLDGAVIDEPADMAPEVFTEVIRPALSDRLGWCAWIGTPKGRNSFFRLYDMACSDPEFFPMLLPASASKIIPQEELDSALKAMGKESYEREYECSFNAAIPGAIYGDLISELRTKGHIQDYEHNKDFPLFTSWDVGDSDFCTQWLLQLEGRHINVLDYYSGTGAGPGHYAEQVRKWEERYNARVMQHLLPHDAQHRHHGSTWEQELKDAGLRNITIVPRTPWVWQGIHELRSLIPRFYIHKTNCSKPFGDMRHPMPSGLDCLEFYHKKEVEENHEIREDPVHDEFSHGADGLRTFAEAHMRGMIEGTSLSARENRDVPVRVLRGTHQPESNTVRKQFRGAVIR